MTPNRTNTRQGINIEELLRNSLPAHQRAFNKVKQSAGIPTTATLTEESDNVGLRKRKTDVVFNFGNKYPRLRASVKSFSKGAGYNQLERKSLANFCRDNRILADDHKFLEILFLRKAKAEKWKRTKLVEQGEKERVRQIFSEIEPGATALLGLDHPQIFAVFSIERNRWHLYDMQSQVLPAIRQINVTFTSTSSNIQLGDYIVLQRKGSAGGEHSGGHPVTDIRHRANDVQMKIRLRRFFDKINPLAFIQL